MTIQFKTHPCQPVVLESESQPHVLPEILFRCIAFFPAPFVSGLKSSPQKQKLSARTGRSIIHSGEFRRGTSSDLLDTELAQLSLQLIELLREVVFALVPELAGLDFGGLNGKKQRSAMVLQIAIGYPSFRRVRTYHGDWLRCCRY